MCLRSVVCCLALFCLLPLSSQAVPPNVLFILADDLGVMDTTLRDKSFYQTPNLERLAARGMVFENGYCAHPRCVPSRFSIQTGISPARDHTHAGPPEVMMKDRTVLAEPFQDNGYATFFAGKWHLGKEEADWPHHCGFDVNIGGCHAGAPGSYFFPWHVVRKTNTASKYGPIFNMAEGEPDEHISERLTKETASWIRTQVAADNPFFAMLSHYAVHTPLEGKPEEVAAYTAKAAGLPNPPKEEFAQTDGQTKIRRDNPIYASMIQTMDDSIGVLLDLLDELNIASNTVVVFTSDHGGLSNRGAPQGGKGGRDVATSNAPYRAGKGHLYEGGLRVPFVVAYPALTAAGSRSDTVAIGTDIFPTLLDLAGLPLLPKQHLDGISLRPALEGKTQTREKKPFIWHSPQPRPTQTGDDAASVIRVENRKLVKRYFPPAIEFYDLKKDPYEKNNLAEKHAVEAKRMQERLENTLLRYDSRPPRKDWKDKTITAPLR